MFRSLALWTADEARWQQGPGLRIGHPVAKDALPTSDLLLLELYSEASWWLPTGGHVAELDQSLLSSPDGSRQLNQLLRVFPMNESLQHVLEAVAHQSRK